MKKYIFLLLALALVLACRPAGASVAKFDDLYLAAESYVNGSDGSGGFSSGPAYFYNSYDALYGSWSGFAYSNTTDTVTPGATNQYSAITGGGVNDSSNYAISFNQLDWENGTYEAIANVITFSSATVVSGAYFTNTTYAYYSMIEGDGFAKIFGGTSGDDPDWFKLIVQGIAEDGSSTGTVEFYLADYRFEDSALDYIVADWSWLDLSSLGAVIALELWVESSDAGLFGMNTPAYFAMDNLTTAAVPVPAAVWLLGSGLLGLAALRRKTRHGQSPDAANVS